MRVGFVGLGKLGYTCAVTMALQGHDVVGFDADPRAMTREPRPFREAGPDGTGDLNDFLGDNFDRYLGGVGSGRLRFGQLAELADHAEIIFVAVQTPHATQFEGTTRLPIERADFDYGWLVSASKALAAHVTRPTPIVVMSTVLPGTLRREVLPVLTPQMKLCYNPSFIAMGTTMRDYLNPEFTLFGVHDEWAAGIAQDFYASLTDAPFYRTTIENAELIKVAYNTFIGMKIVFANTLMEICHKLPGTDVDEVTDGLKLAHRRLLSPAYLSGGMGDGGACHPRDNIALSWLSRQLDLSHDWFESVMQAREQQAEWLCRLVADAAKRMTGDGGNDGAAAATDVPVHILGYSFKKETNIVTGSPALLCENILLEWGFSRLDKWDPFVDGPTEPSWTEPCVVLVGTQHPHFVGFAGRSVPPGSTIVDPWRYVPDVEGVNVIRVGEATTSATEPRPVAPVA